MDTHRPVAGGAYAIHSFPSVQHPVFRSQPSQTIGSPAHLLPAAGGLLFAAVAKPQPRLLMKNGFRWSRTFSNGV
jgi:hypothetical protein